MNGGSVSIQPGKPSGDYRGFVTTLWVNLNGDYMFEVEVHEVRMFIASSLPVDGWKQTVGGTRVGFAR